jgi:hypothetical protein
VEDLSAPESSGPASTSATTAVRDLDSVSAIWPAVVELVRGENALLGAVICEAQPVAVDGEDLTLAFASTAQFLKKKAEDREYRAAVGEALRAVAGGRWRLSYELREELATVDGAASGERSEEEWVAHFMREFDAVEIADDGEPLDAQDAREDERGAQPVISNEKGA